MKVIFPSFTICYNTDGGDDMAKLTEKDFYSEVNQKIFAAEVTP